MSCWTPTIWPDSPIWRRRRMRRLSSEQLQVETRVLILRLQHGGTIEPPIQMADLWPKSNGDLHRGLSVKRGTSSSSQKWHFSTWPDCFYRYSIPKPCWRTSSLSLLTLTCLGMPMLVSLPRNTDFTRRFSILPAVHHGVSRSARTTAVVGDLLPIITNANAAQRDLLRNIRRNDRKSGVEKIIGAAPAP